MGTRKATWHGVTIVLKVATGEQLLIPHTWPTAPAADLYAHPYSLPCPRLRPPDPGQDSRAGPTGHSTCSPSATRWAWTSGSMPSLTRPASSKNVILSSSVEPARHRSQCLWVARMDGVHHDRGRAEVGHQNGARGLSDRLQHLIH